MEKNFSVKRIAIVSSSFPPFSSGGVSSAHFNLYKVLKSRGYNVKVFTFQDYGKIDKTNQEDVERRGTHPFVLKLLRRIEGFYFKFKDESGIHYQTYDILASFWGSFLARKLIARYKPDVLILPDHGAPGLAIPKLKGCTTILVSHHNPKRFLNNHLLGWHSEVDAKIAIDLENRVLKKVDKIICPSTYMSYQFKETYLFDGPVTVIPNILDFNIIDSIEKADIRLKLGLSNSAPVVYIPSAGSRLKGSKFTFEIIRRIADKVGGDIGFYLSGNIDNELRYELSLLPTNVKLYAPGHVSYSENIAIVKSCSFGISPTLIENLSMAILEAIYCSVPMISFNVGGNSDIISNGENGFLVPYLDIESLIKYSTKLLDEEFRIHMRSRTLDTIDKKFNYLKISQMYVDYIFS